MNCLIPIRYLFILQDSNQNDPNPIPTKMNLSIFSFVCSKYVSTSIPMSISISICYIDIFLESHIYSALICLYVCTSVLDSVLSPNCFQGKTKQKICHCSQGLAKSGLYPPLQSQFAAFPFTILISYTVPIKASQICHIISYLRALQML